MHRIAQRDHRAGVVVGKRDTSHFSRARGVSFGEARAEHGGEDGRGQTERFGRGADSDAGWWGADFEHEVAGGVDVVVGVVGGGFGAVGGEGSAAWWFVGHFLGRGWGFGGVGGLEGGLRRRAFGCRCGGSGWESRALTIQCMIQESIILINTSGI